MVEQKASNFLSFIVVSILNEILYTMSCIIKFTHKSCFSVEMVIAVCNIIFKDNLKSILITKLGETDKLYKQYKEKLKIEAAKKKDEAEKKDVNTKDTNKENDEKDKNEVKESNKPIEEKTETKEDIKPVESKIIKPVTKPNDNKNIKRIIKPSSNKK